MTLRCTHDLSERETACADGMCPICLGEAMTALAVEHQGCSAEIDRLRAIVRVNGLRWGHSHAEIDALLDRKD